MGEYNYQSMEKQSKAVYDALVKQGGYIYVCGKIAMADQVFKSFVSIVAQNLIKDKSLEGNEEKMKLARQTAEDFVNSLRIMGNTTKIYLEHKLMCFYIKILM